MQVIVENNVVPFLSNTVYLCPSDIAPVKNSLKYLKKWEDTMLDLKVVR